MTIMGYRQVSADWHMLRTADGYFFGYSEEQVREKASHAAMQRQIAAATAGKMLPLLEQQAAACRR